MVIPKVAAPVRVTIPAQCALICWSNGVEHLAVQTQFSATGTNFAWIIPLPAKPVIEEATPGLFTTLEYLCRPAIIHDVFPWYSILLAGAGLVYLSLTVRRNTPPRITDLLVSLGVAAATLPLAVCIALPLAVLLPYAAWRIRTGQESVSAILAAFFMVLILGGLMLPALSAGVRIVTQTSVSVLSQATVGIYDTTTVSSDDPRALASWLRDNDYAVPPVAGRVISNYVQRHWVFVAAKVRRDAAVGLNSPHPLCFTFTATNAVFPMQLTGAGNTNLEVQLFVFGPSRAEARFFRTERCSGTTFLKPADSIHIYNTKKIPVVHPLLRQWAAGSQVATELAARLSPEEMVNDIEIHWGPFVESQRKLYSNQGAGICGLNVGSGIFVCGLLVAGVGIAVKPGLRRHWRQLVLGATGVGAVTAVLIFVSLPSIPVRLTRLPALMSRTYLQELGIYWSMIQETNRISTLAEARTAVKLAEVQYPKLTQQNYLLGGPIREEDSPGNYTFRESTNGVQFIWYDANGGEHSQDN